MPWAPLAVLLLMAGGRPSVETCTYREFSWDVRLGRAVGHRTVSKPRHALTPEERDPTVPDCTVCREDQVEIALPGLPSVEVCHVFADRVRAALEAIQASGRFRVEALTGYRVGRSRGPVVNGRRTQLSNHAYGTAIDVNARHNGLYGRCRLDAPAERAADLRGCRRLIGGRWDPRRRPRTTVVRGGVAHRAFGEFWKWGGDLPGEIKDFMHFSVTGE